jgi:threonine dehydratase
MNLSAIRQAQDRIRDGIVRTPAVPAPGLSDLAPCPLYLKLENLQRTGSFKDRGSLNRLLDLSPEQKKRGVVTASAGNHAQAVAYHCARLGIPAALVMPDATPLIKISNSKRYGARVTLQGATLSDAMSEAQRLEAEEGLTLVHPFDDDLVIAGQGTAGLELAADLPELDDHRADWRRRADLRHCGRAGGVEPARPRDRRGSARRRIRTCLA